MATINSKIEGVDVLGVVTAGETIYVGRATSAQHGIVKPAATDFNFDAETNALQVKLGKGLERTEDGIAIIPGSSGGSGDIYGDIQANINTLTNVNLTLGNTTVDYDTTDGIQINSTGRFTYEGGQKDVTVNLDVPITGSNGIVIDKASTGEIVEVKVAAPLSLTSPSASPTISITNNNTPKPAISIDVTNQYGPPTSSGLVVNNGTNYVKVGGRAIAVGSDSSSKEIRITETDVVCMNSATGDLDYFLRQGNVKTINGQSIYGSGNIPILESYPVGSIYLSTSSTSPSSLFGGTWEQIKDVFLLAAGDTYTAGSTGGSADAVVVRHGGHVRPSSVDSGSIATEDWEVAPNSSDSYCITIDKLTAYGDRRPFAKELGNEGGFRTLYKGESGTGKNMPPYLAVCMWKRIA